MTELLYSVEDLNKSYTSGDYPEQVLRGIALDIEFGEVLSIVGASGSGKTTLLNILAALDSDYTGSVQYRGRELKALSDPALSELRNRDFGFVFQQFNLLDHLTVEENVILPVHFGTGQSGDPHQRATELLNEVGLSEHRGKYPTQLSGGQKQRVSAARALINSPDVVFCDEPTGSLDRTTGTTLMELFGELNEETDTTFVIVTHETYIAEFGERIIRLEEGGIAEAERPREISEPVESECDEVAQP